MQNHARNYLKQHAAIQTVAAGLMAILLKKALKLKAIVVTSLAKKRVKNQPLKRKLQKKQNNNILTFT